MNDVCYADRKSLLPATGLAEERCCANIMQGETTAGSPIHYMPQPDAMELQRMTRDCFLFDKGEGLS